MNDTLTNQEQQEAIERAQQRAQDEAIALAAQLRVERDRAQAAAEATKYPTPIFEKVSIERFDPWPTPPNVNPLRTPLSPDEWTALFADNEHGTPPRGWFVLSADTRASLGGLLRYVIRAFGVPFATETTYRNERTRRAKMLAVVQVALRAASSAPERLESLSFGHDRDMRHVIAVFGKLDERVWAPVFHDVREHFPTDSLREMIAKLDIEKPFIETVADELLEKAARFTQKVRRKAYTPGATPDGGAA